MRLSPPDRENKIRLHCATLARVIEAVRPAYLESAESQRALVETMIGAAIWYVPKPRNAWTGMISVAALRSFHPESGVIRPKVSEEHVYPRKVAAKQLLEETTLDEEKMLQTFVTRYALIHYITPDENKVVTRFQRTSVFTSPEEAYERAGIHFLTINQEDFRQIKKRDKELIETYLNKLIPPDSSTPPPHDLPA
jgi:hypothetical protein